MKAIIKALLGASMLAPIAAQAPAQQVAPDRDGQIEMRGARGDSPRERREAMPAQQPRWDADPAVADGRDRPARQDRAPSIPDADEAARSQADRALRQERHDDRAEFRGQRSDDRQDFAHERRDDRASSRDRAITSGQARTDRWDVRAGRGDDRQGYGADRRVDGADAARTRRSQWNGDAAWNDGHSVNDRRGWNSGRGWDGGKTYRPGSNWARDWRHDQRYDGNRYRSSNYGAYRLPRYYAPPAWSYGYRRFSIGVTLSSVLWSQNYWIDDPHAYRLPEAYGPYRWVRYYNDALLVDVRTGRVVDLVNEIFW